MTTEYDKLTIGDRITINIAELAKDTRYQTRKETVTFLEKLRLRDLKFEYEIKERAEETVEPESQPFISVYLFGLLDGYKKLDMFEEHGELTTLHDVKYYHYNVVSKYIEEGKEEFLDIMAELEEGYKSSKQRSNSHNSEEYEP